MKKEGDFAIVARACRELGAAMRKGRLPAECMDVMIDLDKDGRLAQEKSKGVINVRFLLTRQAGDLFGNEDDSSSGDSCPAR